MIFGQGVHQRGSFLKDVRVVIVPERSPLRAVDSTLEEPVVTNHGSTPLLLGQSHGGDIDDHGRVQVKDVLHLLGEPFVELGGEGGDALCRSQETTAADLGEHAFPYLLDQFLCGPLLLSGDLTDLLRLRLCELDAEYRHASPSFTAWSLTRVLEGAQTRGALWTRATGADHV